jgi:hypothetical protein
LIIGQFVDGVLLLLFQAVPEVAHDGLELGLGQGAVAGLECAQDVRAGRWRLPVVVHGGRRHLPVPVAAVAREELALVSP